MATTSTATAAATAIAAAKATANTISFCGGTRKQQQQQVADEYQRFSLLAASNVDAFLQTAIVPQVGVFRGGLADVLPATDFQALAVSGSLLASRWMLNRFCLDGDGPISAARLRRACSTVVQALDILRTVFVPSGGRFLQVVLRTLRPAFRVVEVDDIDTYNVNEEDDEHDIPRPGEPFVGFTLVRHRHSARHRIVLRLSHAQYDGVCFPRIVEALAAAYRGEAVPRPPTFANYLRASAPGALTAGHYRHWRELLAGAAMTEIVRRRAPTFYAPPPDKTWTRRSLARTVRLPPVDAGRVTTATVVKAAWAYALAQLSASADVVFGHTISGRSDAAGVDGVSDMVGPCLNLVPVRVRFDVDPAQTARGLLAQVQEQQVANMAHEVLGFREIVRRCTAWPAWTYFSSTVQHQSDAINRGASATVRVGDVDYRVGCATVSHEDFADLSVLSQRAADGDSNTYEIMLSFADGGPVPCAFAERALDMLCDAARQFAANPDAALPSAADLRAGQRQVPFGDAVVAAPNQPLPTDDEEDDGTIENLTDPRMRDLAAVVAAAWRQVLLQDDIAAANQEPPEADIDLDTSFFDLGGDIVGLAQLVGLLDHAGYAVPRLEDLIYQPTVRGHMAVLATLPCAAVPASPAMSTPPASPITATAAEQQQQHHQQIPKSPRGAKAPKIGFPALARAVKLAKGLTKRKSAQAVVSAPAGA